MEVMKEGTVYYGAFLKFSAKEEKDINQNNFTICRLMV